MPCNFAKEVANDSCGCLETRIANVTHAVVYLLMAVLSLVRGPCTPIQKRYQRVTSSLIRDATYPHTSQWGSFSHCLGYRTRIQLSHYIVALSTPRLFRLAQAVSASVSHHFGGRIRTDTHQIFQASEPLTGTSDVSWRRYAPQGRIASFLMLAGICERLQPSSPSLRDIFRPFYLSESLHSQGGWPRPSFCDFEILRPCISHVRRLRSSSWRVRGSWCR
jgi:hypothetical protein